MFAQPMMGRAPNNVFLLNPEHEGFLNGGERKFKDFSRALIILLVIVIPLGGLVGGVMGFIGVDELLTRSQLEQSGVPARASVIDVDYDTTMSDGRKTYTYFLTYAYSVRPADSDQATRYTYRQEINSLNYNNFSPGDKLTVSYLPDNPGVSRYMDDNTQSDTPFVPMGVVFGGLALLGLYFVLRQRRRNKRLEEEGQFVTGKLSKVSGGRVRGGYQVNIEYTFVSPNGTDLKRKESHIRNDLDRDLLPQTGTSVMVVYVNDRLFRVL